MDNQEGKNRRLEYVDQEIALTRLATDGWVLDVGGGGEGTIGQLMGRQVVSIDLWKDELLEAQGEALKIVMDARAMGFLDNSFSCATAFFMMMYVPSADREQVLREIYRVLVPGATLHIWDVEFPADQDGCYEWLVVRPVVSLPDRVIRTGFGVPWSYRIHGEQIRALAEGVGFSFVEYEQPSAHTWTLVLRK